MPCYKYTYPVCDYIGRYVCVCLSRAKLAHKLHKRAETQCAETRARIIHRTLCRAGERDNAIWV